ncbi:hypothetical protein HYV10_00300 [Candidatus Dependentiae bacterium]|nr:hypothetical protein [Candidatus Dependentiae bacterium]
MSQKKLFLTISLCSSILQTSSTPAQPSITLHLNNAANSNNHAMFQQSTLQEIKHTHVISFELPNFKIPSMLDHFQNPSKSFWGYKWYTAASIASAAYVYLNFKLYTAYKLLEDPKSWSLWKEEIPLNRLMTIDKTELYKQLKMDIAKKYFNVADSTKEHNFLMKFLEDINNEKNLLEFYQSAYHLSKFALFSNMLASRKSLEQINQYIARIDFIIDLYLEIYAQNNNN